MKRLLTIMLLIVLCLSCVGCGTSEEPVPCGHEPYLPLIALLESGEYEGAKNWINDTYAIVETETVPATGDIPAAAETTAPTPKNPGTDKIEVTSENFLDYFEYTIDYDFRENAFGEVERVWAMEYIRLKEEYVPRLISGNEIAVELAYHRVWSKGTLDYENKTFIPNGEYEPSSFGEGLTKVFELSQSYGSNTLEHALGFATPAADGSEAFRVAIIDEVLRARGTLCLTAE